MTIMKPTIIAILSLVVSFTISNHALAAENTSSWSLDSIYQSLQQTITISGDTNISNSDLTSVSATSSPATSKATLNKVAKKYVVTATAYSSSVDETDDTPFITARGTYVRDGIIATNFLPFGTAVKIPDLFGDKIFVVEDRMNRRYTDRIDLWFPSKSSALRFGVRTVSIEIVS